MAIRTLIDRLRRTVHELRTANGANVSVTFALATIPIVGAVGAAVDYSHANSVKTALQAATDSTALMLSKTASTMPNSQIQTAATNYLTALFNRPEATGLTVTATYTASSSQLVVLSSANVKTNFMGLMGMSTMKVGADAQVKWGNSRLRVALVLDNTGSMSDDGKMTALKTATNNLLDQLKAAASKDGDVYVSIVPFVKDVNVGASNYQANWIDWTDWDANNGSCSKKPWWGSYNNKSDCQNAGGNWTHDNHNTRNGCVVDRGDSNAPNSANYDTNVAGTNPAITATLFAAEQYNSCPQAVKALSYDWTGMNNLVSAMSPNGNTNQAIGLAHGWMSLVGGGPYPTPPTMDANYKYSQIIILLTDGLKTQDRWYTSQNSIDTRQAMTCSNIKAAGITLYTIQVNTGGDPTSSLLQTCASDSSKFFLLTSATQIVKTFQQIGTNLSNLRLAQ
jgi:Flp pilus assembly protein TadG